MQRKGYYTGKKVWSSYLDEYVEVGKISGYRGNGEPVYDCYLKGKKVGEIGNKKIKFLIKSDRDYIKNINKLANT